MMKLTDVYAARLRMGHWVRRTPLEYSRLLSELTDGEVWLKLENRQITGSFKIRGASSRLSLLTPEERKRGVVAASSGNHAQGVGYSARELGVKAIIVVPENTPNVKREAIRALGVELIIQGEEYMEAERLAQSIGRERGLPFISPYNDPFLIAGQGTVGLEMIEEEPSLNTILVPVSGGGLISGIATVYKAANDAEIIGIQTEASPVMYESIKAGRIVDIPMFETVAEGLHGGIEHSSITFSICQKMVDDWVVVREQSIIDSLRLLLQNHHEVVEGSGAVGVAAIMEQPKRFRNRRIGVVISGGNIDDTLLKTLLK